jgi:hypothetical protein
MTPSIALSATLVIGFFAASSERASAVNYCQYSGQPAGCVLRPSGAVAPTPPSTGPRPSGLVRQDLFDRSNPNNLRSDWPPPRAQPGQ